MVGSVTKQFHCVLESKFNQGLAVIRDETGRGSLGLICPRRYERRRGAFQGVSYLDNSDRGVVGGGEGA